MIEHGQKNFLLWMIAFGLSALLMVVSIGMNWDIELVMVGVFAICAIILFGFRSKPEAVQIQFDGEVLEVYARTEKSVDTEPSLRYVLADLTAFRCARSGRYAELLCVDFIEAEQSTRIVFSTSPSPDQDDPLRRMESLLKKYVTS